MPDSFAESQPPEPDNRDQEVPVEAILLELDSPGPEAPEPESASRPGARSPVRRVLARRDQRRKSSDARQQANLETTQTGRSCQTCGAPLDAADRFCTSCGNSQQQPPEDHQRAQGTGPLSCRNCGATITTELDRRSYVCPFCDSAHVVELPEALSGRTSPEFIVPFAVTRDQALAKFNHWMRQNSWLRPGDLAVAHVRDKLQGVYLPFWSFAMLAESKWQASIGEYWYRTETYTTTDSKGRTVTRTRRVRETEWWPLSGRHHRYYSGYLVSSSRGLTQQDATGIMPFQLAALKRFAPQFLAGWMCEEYSLEEDQARAICEAEFRRRAQSDIADFLPGDTYSGLKAQVRLSKLSEDLILLPIYVLTYKYEEKTYRFLVNGQTGKTSGDKPWSIPRISLLVGVVVGVILLVLGLWWLWPWLTGSSY